MAAESKATASELQITERSTGQPLPEVTRNLNDLYLWKSIKQYPKVVGWTLAVMTGLLYVGYDAVIVGTITALPWFQRDFGDPVPNGSSETKEWILPATWISLWSAFTNVGALIMAIFAGWYQDRFGRRLSLAYGSAISIGAIAIMYCSNLPTTLLARRSVFLASKIVQGLSIGMITATARTYISEIAPVSLRGPAMALFPVFILIGQLIGAIVVFRMEAIDSPRSYLTALATQWPFAALPMITGIFMPQSPAWLVQRERYDEARAAHARLHKATADVVTEFDRTLTVVALEKANAAENSYWDCFKGINRRRTAIIILTSTLPSFFGLPLLSSASYFLQQVGMKPLLSLIFLIIGIVLGFIGNATGTWMLSRFGRRILSITTMSVTSVIWFAMGIAGVWPGFITTIYTAISLMGVVIICGLGVWPASYAIAAETSSLQLRARSQGIAVLANQAAQIVCELVLPYLYNRDAADLRSKTGFIYCAICAIGTVLCWFMIPEMKGRSAAEINRMFEMKLPVRAFKRANDLTI